METFLLYLALKADAIKDLLLFISLFGGVGIGIAALASNLVYYDIKDKRYYSDGEQEITKKFAEKSWLLFKQTFAMFLFMSIISALMPSTKDIAVLYAVPKIKQGVVAVAKNKQVQQIPDKILQLTNQKLDEMIKGDAK